MDAAAFLFREIGKREVAHLRMNGVDAPVELHKRRVKQFLARVRPVLHQFFRHSSTCRTHNALQREGRMLVIQQMFAFQPHRRSLRRLCFRVDQHDNLLATERQFESRQVGEQQARRRRQALVGHFQRSPDAGQRRLAQFATHLLKRARGRLRGVDAPADGAGHAKDQFRAKRVAIELGADILQNSLLLAVVQVNTLMETALPGKFLE